MRRGAREALKTAIESYNGSVVERGTDEVKTSKMRTEMLHDWDRVKVSPLFKMGTRKLEAQGE